LSSKTRFDCGVRRTIAREGQHDRRRRSGSGAYPVAADSDDLVAFILGVLPLVLATDGKSWTHFRWDHSVRRNDSGDLLESYIIPLLYSAVRKLVPGGGKTAAYSE